MIDLYFAPTPNGWKPAILLEELGVPYTVKLMALTKGEQFTPEFLAINPNAKMPAIVDHEADGGPLSVWESATILMYLARKYDRFWPQGNWRFDLDLTQWMFWQTGNQGPMMGQLSHFKNYAPDDNKAYGFKRYKGESERALAVLERRLEGRTFIMGEDYTIADMQCFPWAFLTKKLGASLDDFPNLTRWRQMIKERPAVQRAIDIGRNRAQHDQNASNNNVLFNQGAGHLLKK
ncbi:MAG: thiol:disulfide oxidoreductase [Alphaproteobacteria bacterium TMED89]|nr:thiol:disulfide oxidoreductase [Rhodospirillaceae bacterium]RPH12886.1 MAG: thiol:disulfide oxidoreductase [Alphaproteobacteria bacterium TMED89]